MFFYRSVLRSFNEVVSSWGLTFTPRSSFCCPCGENHPGLRPPLHRGELVTGFKFSSWGGVRRSREVGCPCPQRGAGFIPRHSRAGGNPLRRRQLFFCPCGKTTPACGHPSIEGNFSQKHRHAQRRQIPRLWMEIKNPQTGIFLFCIANILLQFCFQFCFLGRSIFLGLF